MNLHGKTLPMFLKSASEESARNGGGLFPRSSIDYYIDFVSFEQNMNTLVHGNVTPGAISHDRGRLTDHGADHIAKVINQCRSLVDGSNIDLSPYEVYLLMKAAHIHDIGNLLGRANHEKKAADVLSAAGISSRDTFEQRAIMRIASVHGGTIEGNHDTISTIPKIDELMGFEVNFQMLAALLRFADELSDDCTRADLASLHLESLPKSAEIYHKYASGLISVRVDHSNHQVNMKFEFQRGDFLRKYGKGKSSVYLIHEILRRTYKLFQEMQYTSQFLLPGIILRRVSVGIKVYDGHQLFDEIGYRVSPDGWTAGRYGSIYSFAPELRGVVGGRPLSARTLRKKYQEA